MRSPALTAGQGSYVVGSEAQLHSTEDPGSLHLPAPIAIILISFGQFLRLVLLFEFWRDQQCLPIGVHK